MAKAIKFLNRMTIDGTVMAFWMAMDGTVMTMAMDDDYAVPAIICCECGWAIGDDERLDGHTVSRWSYPANRAVTYYVCNEDECREACGCWECDKALRDAAREAWEDLQTEIHLERQRGIW